MTQQPVTVRFKILISDRPDSGGPMIFSHWLPVGPERGIRFQHEACDGLLWFEMKSAPWIDHEASLERTVNVQVESMIADVIITVDSDLAAWMAARDCRHAPPAEEKEMADAHERQGQKVLAALDHGVNRFLSFVRVEKGQHWIRHLNLDSGRAGTGATALGAKATLNGSDWFRWCPTNVINLVGEMPRKDDPRFIRPVDWPRVQDFVSGTAKPTLTLELLAGAESLAREGSDRAALAEAVSALEVALARFARSGRIDELLPEFVRSRLRVESLPNLIQRMGVTASVALLLPFLLPEQQLSKDLLKTCGDAIAERQTVVHQGQREVDAVKLRKYLAALRGLCETLLRYSDA